jgi:hypothetical protein
MLLTKDNIGALDFSGRSPFARRSVMPGVPVADTFSERLRFVGNVATIAGVPLAPINREPQQLISAPPSAAQTQVKDAAPVFDTGQYGDADTIQITFAAAGERMVLPRPNNTRTLLLIQNLTVVANIHYCFDRQADNVSAVAIGPGGNRLFDGVVPQGELHIFSTGAGIVIVEYMNKNIR